MRSKNTPLLAAGAASLLLGACSNDDALTTAPSAAARPSTTPLGAVSTAAGPGPLLSGLAPNVCADVWRASRASGAPVVAHRCNGGANQRFELRPSGEIAVYDGALCLDVWQARANDGDPVVAHTCNGGTNQRWTRTAAGELRTAVNGKCLDLWGARAVDGARLAVHSCHGGANQKWTVQASGSGDDMIADTVAVGGSAELPRTYLDTRMPTPTGRTIGVPAGGDLQAALDAAQPGDEIVLPAGATFVGNFVLRPKANAAGQWVTVRTGGALPAEGTRVGPGDAGQMPKLLTPNAAPALKTDPAAQGWRIVGLELGLAAGLPWTYTIVAFGSSGSEQSSPAQVPSRLVLDRSYVHASPATDVRRCVTLNSASTAIIDSYLAECHSRDSESQAVLGWNGPGPFKIVNNRLEGGHEVIVFGGGDPSVANTVASDVEIRRNHVVRPAAWRGVWPAKNLVEFKAGRRVLMEGNVFENNWPDAQNGFAFLWWSVNQDGGCTSCSTTDVTFRYNRVRNVAGGFNLTTTGDRPVPPLQRVTIAHNVITGLDGSNGRLYLVNGGVGGLTIANNSGFGVDHDILFATPDQPLPGLVFRNNVTGAYYSFFAASTGMGNAALRQMQIPAANVAGNVFASGSGAGSVPGGNAYAPSAAAVGLVDLAGGDLTIAPGSPYRSSGVGGTRPGADMLAVAQQTQGVVR